ncbi:MAG: type I-MYXAN CRISPR-associated protein Cas5/Cmx5/DevS [Pyrinomonadaceae bacterium]
MKTIGLYVSVPVACFRVPRAREYFETFPCPPPATVYGMLLSMVGEINRRAHEGAEIAIALLSEPHYSVVLRTLWRVKDKNAGPGLGNNRRPDFQELLTDVQLAVWVRQGAAEEAEIPLALRIQKSLDSPATVSRFGGLSLGESTHLVDSVSRLKLEDMRGRLLVAAEDGDLSLPIWPDHVGSATTWGQYRLTHTTLNNESLTANRAWTAIKRD